MFSRAKKLLVPTLVLLLFVIVSWLWSNYDISRLLFPAPLLTAAEVGNTPAVEDLLHAGADMEVQGANDMTPLMRAAEFGHGDTVQVLLAHGANVEARDASGCTALHVAASHFGTAEVIDCLLQHDANPNVVDNEGRTALLWACVHGNAETVRTLIAYGADVNRRDSQGKTALAMAMGDREEMSNNIGNPLIAEMLIAAGARR